MKSTYWRRFRVDSWNSITVHKFSINLISSHAYKWRSILKSYFLVVFKRSEIVWNIFKFTCSDYQLFLFYSKIVKSFIFYKPIRIFFFCWIGLLCFIKGPLNTVNFYFNYSKQHGDFNLFWNCLHRQILIVSLCIACGISSVLWPTGTEFEYTRHLYFMTKN